MESDFRCLMWKGPQSIRMFDKDHATTLDTNKKRIRIQYKYIKSQFYHLGLGRWSGLIRTYRDITDMTQRSFCSWSGSKGPPSAPQPTAKTKACGSKALHHGKDYCNSLEWDVQRAFDGKKCKSRCIICKVKQYINSMQFVRVSANHSDQLSIFHENSSFLLRFAGLGFREWLPRKQKLVMTNSSSSGKADQLRGCVKAGGIGRNSRCHIDIHMRVEQKVHERGFLCVSLWICSEQSRLKSFSEMAKVIFFLAKVLAKVHVYMSNFAL